MASSGMGVIFWPPVNRLGWLPFGGGLVDTNAGGVSNCLLYLADRDYTITHVVLSNNATTLQKARLAITAGGVVTAANDSSKVMTISLDPGQIFDWTTRIPLRSGYGLVGIADVALGDQFIYGGITGEVSD